MTISFMGFNVIAADKVISEWENEHSLKMDEAALARVLLLCNKEHVSSKGGLRMKLSHFMSPRKGSVDHRTTNSTPDPRRHSVEVGDSVTVSNAVSVDDNLDTETEVVEVDGKFSVSNPLR